METLNLRPVVEQEPFIGRKLELEWLADKLGRASPQQCNLVGEPRIGKTSLLAHVYQNRVGLPEGMSGLYVLVRLSPDARRDSTAFWIFFLDCLRRERSERSEGSELAPGQPVPAKPSFETLFGLVQQEIEQILARFQRLVVLIDNAAHLFSGPHPQVGVADLDDPDQSLRALLTRFEGRLAFVFSSQDPLGELYRARYSRQSALLSLVLPLQVGLLGADEAAQLARRLGEGELEQSEVSFILQEAGCHPQFIRRACAIYLDARRSRAGFGDLAGLYEDVQSDIRYDSQVDWLCEILYTRRAGLEGAQEALRAIAAGQGQSLLEERSGRLLVRHLERLGLVSRVEPNGIRLPVLFSAVFRDRVRGRAGDFQSAPPPPPEAKGRALLYLPEQHLLRLGEQLVALTGLEERLLAYLYARPGQVCSPANLLQDVWGGAKTPSVVEKTINRLRQKLEQDPKRPEYLISMYGKGYLLRHEPVE